MPHPFRRKEVEEDDRRTKACIARGVRGGFRVAPFMGRVHTRGMDAAARINRSDYR